MKNKMLGYKCQCGLESDLKKDFIITERDVVCKKCGSGVYPMDILKGVILK